MNDQEFILYLNESISKKKEELASLERIFNNKKKNCNHTFKDGNSALKDCWMYTMCEICGANDGGS